MVFRGTFEHAIDDKARVAIPSKYREALSGLQEERLMVTRFRSGEQRCLDVYPLSAWRQLEEKILAMRRFNPELQRFKRVYVSGAHECALDGQGRILVPQHLRDYAGIKRDVVFTGEIDIFKIWSRDTWRRIFEQDEGIFDQPDVMDRLGL
ncbi:MAG TPA: division/cell wall cluster transcriptional repressor MraZ [Candidatus Eisenbacteria bacterium]|nr:division/cell wall cluster transcriptional repressor MraZ [Candidatus Eisenbacteria bacterium]